MGKKDGWGGGGGLAGWRVAVVRLNNN